MLRSNRNISVFRSSSNIAQMLEVWFWNFDSLWWNMMMMMIVTIMLVVVLILIYFSRSHNFQRLQRRATQTGILAMPGSLLSVNSNPILTKLSDLKLSFEKAGLATSTLLESRLLEVMLFLPYVAPTLGSICKLFIMNVAIIWWLWLWWWWWRWGWWKSHTGKQMKIGINGS